MPSGVSPVAWAPACSASATPRSSKRSRRLYLRDKTWAEDPALTANAERWGPVARALTALRN